MNNAQARATAIEPSPPGGTPTRIVCAALALAVLVLVVRIAAIW